MSIYLWLTKNREICIETALYKMSKNIMNFLYNLKTPTKTVLRCLYLLSQGKALRKTARLERVTTDSIYNWINRANKHLGEVMLLFKEELKLAEKEIVKIRKFILQRAKQ